MNPLERKMHSHPTPQDYRGGETGQGKDCTNKLGMPVQPQKQTLSIQALKPKLGSCPGLLRSRKSIGPNELLY